MLVRRSDKRDVFHFSDGCTTKILPVDNTDDVLIENYKNCQYQLSTTIKKIIRHSFCMRAKANNPHISVRVSFNKSKIPNNMKNQKSISLNQQLRSPKIPILSDRQSRGTFPACMTGYVPEQANADWSQQHYWVSKPKIKNKKQTGQQQDTM
jgi:hypothetical protein